MNFILILINITMLMLVFKLHLMNFAITTPMYLLLQKMITTLTNQFQQLGRQMYLLQVMFRNKDLYLLITLDQKIMVTREFLVEKSLQKIQLGQALDTIKKDIVQLENQSFIVHLEKMDTSFKKHLGKHQPTLSCTITINSIRTIFNKLKDSRNFQFL